jgi:hypothetical protein
MRTGQERGCRGIKKNGKQALGKSRGGLHTKMPMMAANNQCAIGFILSGERLPMQANNPGEYDKELYKQRNEAERKFRRLKGFRWIGTRYEKLDLMFSMYIYLALCVIALCLLISRSVNRP